MGLFGIDGNNRNASRGFQTLGNAIKSGVKTYGDMQDKATTRDVLLNTNKSLEFDNAVNDQYDELNSNYADLDNEYNRKVDGINKYTRGADGSYLITPEFQEANDTYKDFSARLNEREAKLDLLNQSAIQANNNGAFSNVSDAEGYSNRVYRGLLEGGIDPEQADKLRKTTLEANKLPDLSEADKVGIQNIRENRKAADRQAELFGIKQQNVQGDPGTGGRVTGANKVLSKEQLAGTYDVGRNTQADAVIARDKALEAVDIDPVIWNDVNRKDIREIEDSFINNPELAANYNPQMLTDIIARDIKNQGALFTDKSITPKDKKKYLKDLKEKLNTVVATNKKQRDSATLLGAGTPGSGSKDLTTTTQLKNAEALAKQFGDNATRAEDAINQILDKSQGKTTDGLIRKYFGDISTEQKAVVKEVIKSEQKVKQREKDFGTPDKDILKGKDETKYLDGLTNKQLRDPKFVDANNPAVKKRLSVLDGKTPEKKKPEVKTPKVETGKNETPKVETTTPDTPRDVLEKDKAITQAETNTKEYKALSPEAKKIVKRESGNDFKTVELNADIKRAELDAKNAKKWVKDLNYDYKTATIPEVKAYEKAKADELEANNALSKAQISLRRNNTAQGIRDVGKAGIRTLTPSDVDNKANQEAKAYMKNKGVDTPKSSAGIDTPPKQRANRLRELGFSKSQTRNSPLVASYIRGEITEKQLLSKITPAESKRKSPIT